MAATTTSGRRFLIGVTCALSLSACAAADDPDATGAPVHDSGRVAADTTGYLPGPDTGRDTRSDPVDEPDSAFGDDTFDGLDSSVGFDSAVDPPTDTAIAPIDTAVDPIDTSVFTDTAPGETLVPVDSGCGGPVATGIGVSCAAPVPISMDASCTVEISGDTCAGASVSTSCGGGQGMIHTVQVSSGIKLYDIKVSSGFQLATIPGPPICGGAGSCVGTGMSTGVSAGATQWWVVLKTGGGCGAYTLTITPR